MKSCRSERAWFFVGPSASAAEVRAACPGALVLPPIQQGDLLRMRNELPEVVAIVDGFFHQVPAVLHKEILSALEAGVRVLGAASMGALRAAELDRFGMEGVGEVYRLYRSGRIDGDDEVAVLHAGPEHDYRPLTEPLVNVRHHLRQARQCGILSPRAATALLRAAKRLHYTERTYPALFQAARISVADWPKFLRYEAVDLKRADALALAHLIAARLRGEQPWPPCEPVQVQRTKYFRILERDYAGHVVNGRSVPERAVLVFHQLLAPAFPRLLRRVVLRCVAGDEAEHRGLSSADRELLLRRFRRAHRLTDELAFRKWMHAHYLSETELALALCEQDQAARLLRSYRRARSGERLLTDVAARLGVRRRDLMGPLFMRPGILWEGPLLRELKYRGHFGDALTTAAAILEFEERLFAGKPELRAAFDALAPTACAAIEAWAARRWRVAHRNLEAALRARGFVRYNEFLDHGRLAHAFEQGRLRPGGEG